MNGATTLINKISFKKKKFLNTTILQKQPLKGVLKYNCSDKTLKKTTVIKSYLTEV